MNRKKSIQNSKTFFILIKREQRKIKDYDIEKLEIFCTKFSFFFLSFRFNLIIALASSNNVGVEPHNSADFFSFRFNKVFLENTISTSTRDGKNEIISYFLNLH